MSKAPSVATEMPARSYEVILSHEHTDFDALASLFGASLLFPDALPVLPSALNSNVSSFLALYKNHFPFLQSRELPKGRVNHVILVDTRTANYPKGMQEDTRYTIIDHHSFEQPLPEHWQIWSEAVGANTTLITERLIERNQPLSPVQATLLALGIHEDTGSLTYVGTTYRDAACLAWLLRPERGVNLEVLQQFLNHPLSEEQRLLLNDLIRYSEFVDVAGHTVVLTQSEAKDFTGELSTLAQRLAAFHEQDAAFLIVDLGDIVQVVARSATDAIDVGMIARRIGGGGHSRAAAAPVHNADTQSVRDRIVELLHQDSHQAITVRTIMSFGTPKAVDPETTVEEAAELMRRYGHEGFPVIEDGGGHIRQVQGILTRREIDRTLNHKMGTLPVARVMQAGSVSVRTTDSVSHLRNVMINSGWGQIPVADETGQIVGIVTRTDLIKLWDKSGFASEHEAQVEQGLYQILRPVQYALLRWIGIKADAMNYSVYIVGGYVRDLLLDTQVHDGNDLMAPDQFSMDIDCVVEGDAIGFARQLQSVCGGGVLTHKRFGTAKWVLRDEDNPVSLPVLKEQLGETCSLEELPEHIDFVSARTEFYTAPTVLPTVERSSIKLDLQRRDFSINTLAIALSQEHWGNLIDLFGGITDLNQGIIRVLHSLSFVDDPTRILRAVRYEQRFGFQIEQRTLELLQDASELLERLSPARIRHELERILQEKKPETIIRRLEQLNVLQAIHPMLQADADLETRFSRVRSAVDAEPNSELAQESIDLLYWGAWVQNLPTGVHEELIRRLALDSRTAQLIVGLHRINQHRVQLSSEGFAPSHSVSILETVSPLALLLYPVISDLTGSPADARLGISLKQYLNEWQFVQPALNGRDLAQMGIPSGPIYTRILNTIRAAKLDGALASRAEEEALAIQIAAGTEQRK